MLNANLIPRRLVLLPAALFICACVGDKADLGFSVWSAHEAYAAGLHHAGLDTTALGHAWMDAASHSLAAPMPITVPLHEAVLLDPS